MIELKNIIKSYVNGPNRFRVLKDISLSVPKGDFKCIMGTSGAGKSTFLNILGCLDRPDSGEYYIDKKYVYGVDEEGLAFIRRDLIGFIFQSFNLIPTYTAIENVALPLIYKGIPYKERRLKAVGLLNKVGLSHRLTHYPNEMSGGEKQRVAIARSLVNDPKLILADEPTGALDSDTSAEVISLLQKINDEGTTILLITHDPKMPKHTKSSIKLVAGQLIEKGT